MKSNSLIKFAECLLAMALGIMVILVLTNVVLRYGFNSGIAASEDLSRLLFIWMTFIGAILGVIDKAHLGMDAVVKLLPTLGRRVCAVISHVVMLGTIGLLLAGSWKLVTLNMDVMAMGAIEYPLAWMYAAGFVGSLGLLVLVANNLRLLLQNKVRDEDLVMVQETEGLTDVERKAQEASQSGRRATMSERKEGAA